MVVWSIARARYDSLVGTVRSLRVLLTRTERRRALLAWWPGVLLTLAFVVVGLRGIDFGYHWDEGEGQLKPVREMVSTGVFLPRMRPYSYNYPSLCRYLVLAPAIPAGIDAAFTSDFEPERIKTAMLRELDAPSYLLRLRSIFLSISALAVLWTFGAGLALRLPRMAAFAAAAALACSWEFGYHARFVATDCIVTEFAAFTLLALGRFWREGRRGWLFAAAISAGLATGTKYTGVALLIPVTLAALLRLPGRRRMRSRVFSQL